MDPGPQFLLGHVAAYDRKDTQLALHPDRNAEMRVPVKSYGEIKAATRQSHGHAWDYDENTYKRVKIDHWKFHHPNGQTEQL